MTTIESDSTPAVSPTHILCHYAEVGLKGKNRTFFETKLRQAIKHTLDKTVPESYESIRRYPGRIIIRLSPSGQAQIEALVSALQNVFGLAYYAPALESRQDLDRLKRDAVQMVIGQTFTTFRVTTRRAYTSTPLSVQQVNEEVGAHLLEHFRKKVDLSNPELTCYIDLFQSKAFLYTARHDGPGGLPVGSGGKAVVLLSGGIDSPVAAWYTLKRGARVIFLHFHAVPQVSPASVEKVRSMVKVLNKYQGRSKLMLVKFAPIQNEIVLRTEPKYRVLLYRRFMLRIAESVAERESAAAIVTGESLGQVASQTLENMGVVEAVTRLPILRPLVGFDKQEIINRARQIGTYEISIQPHQDCCTLYVPKHPATRARLHQVEREEQELDILSLVDQAITTMEIEYPT
jgi:thiamine biosynthesis protein ThiI